MAAGLQRSASTFRRSGSSGLVWDEKFLTGELGDAESNKEKPPPPKEEEEEGVEGRELRHSRSVGSAGMMARNGRSHSKSAVRVREPSLRTVQDVQPDDDPPSPKLSGCMPCGAICAEREPRSKPSRPTRR